MESVIASVSGYHGLDRHNLIKMIDKAGAVYVGKMTPSTTHLVCWKFEGKKYNYAKENNILVVNHRWVEDCIEERRRLPEKNYLAQSGQEVGPIRFKLPLINDKENLSPPCRYNTPNDHQGPVSGDECEVVGDHGWTRSCLFTEKNSVPEVGTSSKTSHKIHRKASSKQGGSKSKYPFEERPLSPLLGLENGESCSPSMLLGRQRRRSTTSAEPSHGRRRLMKKNIELVSSDSELESNPDSVCRQSNDVRTSVNQSEGRRCGKRLRRIRNLDDWLFSGERNRREGLEVEVENLNILNPRDSNGHNEDAPKPAVRNSEHTYSTKNEKKEDETGEIPRLPSSTEVSCVICWTDFSSSRGVLPCGHRFCFSCIQSWADAMAERRKASTCPLCKASFAGIRKVDDAASSDQKIYSQSIPDNHHDDFVILPDVERPIFRPQPFTSQVCVECGSREPEDLLVRCHFCQTRCVHSYCLDPPLLPWTCIHCKDLRRIYQA